MIKKTQKLIIIFEGIQVETTIVGLSHELVPLADKLYDQTAEWQADGLGTPPQVSMLIRGYCVSATWRGKAPACRPRIKEIMGIEAREFLSKQYTHNR